MTRSLGERIVVYKVSELLDRNTMGTRETISTSREFDHGLFQLLPMVII